ncbi:MAG TPA: redoxin domain-containing protein [Candidatus Thermoplasmatota archaeon]|nr:redoxin domain-containing protein [Candidatus Thermoplasmatota archaeon]
MAIPAPGARLPDFTLPLATAEGRKEFRLSEQLGKGPIVFGFFPIAFSGICTKEMCDLRDTLPSFQGAQVYGFSTDTPFANAEFAKLNSMPQGIVSDPNREVVERIWETMAVAGVQRVAKRGAMVVAPDGTVKWASASDDPKVWVGSEEIRKQLAPLLAH